MESKKEIWKLVINVLVAALSAIATALGVTSCM
ncbi:MAG: smalltalk protein [Bacteroidales bacterium]|nr:smalltalk protein [Bacteroidales bacterium]